MTEEEQRALFAEGKAWQACNDVRVVGDGLPILYACISSGGFSLMPRLVLLVLLKSSVKFPVPTWYIDTDAIGDTDDSSEGTRLRSVGAPLHARTGMNHRSPLALCTDGIPRRAS